MARVAVGLGHRAYMAYASGREQAGLNLSSERVTTLTSCSEQLSGLGRFRGGHVVTNTPFQFHSTYKHFQPSMWPTSGIWGECPCIHSARSILTRTGFLYHR